MAFVGEAEDHDGDAGENEGDDIHLGPFGNKNGTKTVGTDRPTLVVWAYDMSTDLQITIIVNLTHSRLNHVYSYGSRIGVTIPIVNHRFAKNLPVRLSAQDGRS